MQVTELHKPCIAYTHSSASQPAFNSLALELWKVLHTWASPLPCIAPLSARTQINTQSPEIVPRCEKFHVISPTTLILLPSLPARRLSLRWILFGRRKRKILARLMYVTHWINIYRYAYATLVGERVNDLTQQQANRRDAAKLVSPLWAKYAF